MAKLKGELLWVQQEVEAKEVEVDEIPINVVNEISWDIDHLSVQKTKMQDTVEHMLHKARKMI